MFGQLKLLAPVLFIAAISAQTASARTAPLATDANQQVDVPDCLDRSGQALAVNNDQVLAWKTSTPNSYHDRAHIAGTLVRVFPDHSGHHHLEVQIGQDASALIEVIYNEDFGATPNYAPGSQIEACGDYITSNQPAGHYPASPDGAIVHWVHRSPNLQRHPSGYLLIDGVLCGADSEDAGPKRRH